MHQVVVVLRDPVLEGNTLRYKVKILRAVSGQGADVSVFIDIIGMPRTPMSFAGVGRGPIGARGIGRRRCQSQISNDPLLYMIAGGTSQALCPLSRRKPY